jgi:hypothetical protein
MDMSRVRPRKSEKLTVKEFEDLETWVKEQPTLYDAYLTIGISAPTLDAVRYKKGQGRPDTIAKLRAVINSTCHL